MTDIYTPSYNCDKPDCWYCDMKNPKPYIKPTITRVNGWSQLDDKFLIEKWNDMSLRKIAKTLLRGRSAISHRARRLKLPYKKHIYT